MEPDKRPAASYVLIVEDEQDLAEQLAQLIQAAGYQTATACNGRVAREMLESATLPFLILLDLLLPELDGFGLLKALRADAACSRIPVCIISALSVDVIVPPDVAATLRKPIDTERLLSLVERHHKRP
jgi:DNA-binding response OmpR family regulator